MGKRVAIPPKVRWEVLARDGFRCRYCGARGGDAVLVVDHADPVSNGGDNEPGNLITSCETCNQGKGASRSTILAELEYRIETLDRVCVWLEMAWGEASGVGWVPGEEVYLHLLRQSFGYREAESILRAVGERLRAGELRADATQDDICNLIGVYAQFINDAYGFAEHFRYELTFDMLVAEHVRFWSEPEWHGGMLRAGRGV